MNIFNNINDKDLEKLLKCLDAKNISFKKNSTIINNASNTNILSIITKGSASIIRIDYNGNKTLIENLKENDLFEAKMFNIVNNELSLIALEDTEYSKYIKYDNVGDVVMVKAQNVKNGTLNRKDLSFISNEVSDALPRSQLLPGDVVMTYVGANIGDVALIDDKYKYFMEEGYCDKLLNSVNLSSAISKIYSCNLEDLDDKINYMVKYGYVVDALKTVSNQISDTVYIHERNIRRERR